MKLKIDLHTHCLECTGLAGACEESARRIVAAARSKGLTGIAVTDHVNPNYGFRIKEIVERQLGNEIVVIPGQEVNRGVHHVIELYFPDNMVFRFVAHPGYPSSRWDNDDLLKGIHGIEINNGNWKVDQEAVKKVARQHGLLMLSNSDAHELGNIGLFYNEIDLDDLKSRCEAGAAC